MKIRDGAFDEYEVTLSTNDALKIQEMLHKISII